jgi:Uma2 family endonuclease
MMVGDCAMSVDTGLITVEEYLAMPDPKEGRTELHHGEAVVIPPPRPGHQDRQFQIQMLIIRVAGPNWVVRVQMAFRPMPEYEVWEADVGCISSQRHKARGDQYLMGAPELVVEVLSPSNTRSEINEKMSICLNNGCVSFWVVDPRRQLVSVTEGNVTRTYGLADSFSCRLFSGEIQVREVFE